jgi:hypothetical protein
MGRILAFLAGLFLVAYPALTGRDWRDIALAVLISVPFWLMVFVRRSEHDIAAELSLLPDAKLSGEPVRIYREGPDGEIYHDMSKDR